MKHSNLFNVLDVKNNKCHAENMIKNKNWAKNMVEKIQQYCSSCGTSLAKDAKFCIGCGEEVTIKDNNEQIKQSTINKEEHKYHKKPILALLLSLFFIGVGQVYNGQVLKGIIFILIGIVLTGLNGLLGLFFIIYSAYDAYKNAKYINENNGNYFYN